MKKHLIAAAVAAAVAVPAMAQNVTMYGILDVNWTALDTDGVGTNSAMGSSALATSRFGVRGSEDLGGGLKAEFQLEGTLLPETGTLGKTTTSGTTESVSNFDREAWVGLAGGFGAARFGTSDVTNANNIDSRVSQMGDLGLISELGTDQKKVVRYTTPKFGNFQAEIGTASPNATTANENTKDRVTAFFGSYEAGALGAYVGHEIKKIDSSYDQKQTTLGVKYDFGVASAGLVYATRDGATSGANDFDQWVISAAMPLSNGYKLHAGYETLSTDNAETTADFKAYTLAVTKSLSKRTSLYAAFIDKDFDTTTADSKQYTVGVLHTF